LIVMCLSGSSGQNREVVRRTYPAGDSTAAEPAARRVSRRLCYSTQAGMLQPLMISQVVCELVAIRSSKAQLLLCLGATETGQCTAGGCLPCSLPRTQHNGLLGARNTPQHAH
jgi:hypothetical protein